MYVSRDYHHSLEYEYILIKPFFIQWTLQSLKIHVTFQFYILHKKFYSHMAIIRNVANSFEMRLDINHIQRNAICINTIFIPKKSINRNCSYMREEFPVKARMVLTSE